MMYREIIQLFSPIPSIENPHIQDTIDFFEVEFIISSITKTSESELISILNRYGFSDKITITISNYSEVFSFCNERPETDFWDRWVSTVEQYDNEDISIRIHIQKENFSIGVINVYHPESFFKHLRNLSVVDILASFNELSTKIDGEIVFYSPEITIPFYSSRISFSNSKSQSIKSKEILSRSSLIDKIKTVSHFTGISDNKLLASDFFFFQEENLDYPVKQKFSTVCFILSIACLFDIVTIEKDKIHYKLNGYKSISGSILLENISKESLGEYFEIYNWVLENGSIHDKIGLARNLISLNLSSTGDLKIDDSVFVSIKSGFKAYEKHNVKQYIELRNKISDQLIGFNEKANKIVENFASGFQKSALVFVSLFSTIIVSKVLSSKDFKNVFTPDATILANTFLGISLLYFFVCRWEIKEQERRFVDSYKNMKLRNEDLLTKDDIVRILNDDIEHVADLQFIRSKKKWYTYLWLGFIFIFFLVVTYLNHLYNINLTKEVSTIKAL